MSDPQISRVPATLTASRPLAGWLHAVWILWRRWRHYRRSRIHLGHLDHRLLADIGMAERARRHECAKWFWQE